VYNFFCGVWRTLYTKKLWVFFGRGHLGSHDLEIRSEGHVFKGMIVALNNQEVFWAQNHPENCSKISPKTLKNASGGKWLTQLLFVKIYSQHKLM
jgi:hypothetical protein